MLVCVLVDPLLSSNVCFRLKKVCFSDESTFEILQNKAQFVRRRRGEKFHSDCVVQTVKHPTKIMIWLVISGKGFGRLYVVKGMMRQDQYKDVLQNRLIPRLEEWFPNGEPYIFMQDGALCHTARSIKAFLAEQNIPLETSKVSTPDKYLEKLEEISLHDAVFVNSDSTAAESEESKEIELPINSEENSIDPRKQKKRRFFGRSRRFPKR
ncbi:uncharacterized protein TNCV_3090811 [Trichonephila clavipes]|uniref:Transposase n=1 Tax=Trichonephila clavipes TaxID=2585209 RepID=A0A8X6W889_TRICX|nr:uncharacterized protein TNCV_3090811 [Trichonephila clavipes]